MNDSLQEAVRACTSIRITCIFRIRTLQRAFSESIATSCLRLFAVSGSAAVSRVEFQSNRGRCPRGKQRHLHVLPIFIGACRRENAYDSVFSFRASLLPSLIFPFFILSPLRPLAARPLFPAEILRFYFAPSATAATAAIRRSSVYTEASIGLNRQFRGNVEHTSMSNGIVKMYLVLSPTINMRP